MIPEKAFSQRGSLTDRQVDVLKRVAQFKSSKQIARELGISHHTVDQRIRAVIEKLGVETRADAARVFIAMQENSGVADKGICESPAYQLSYLASVAGPAEQEASAGEWNPVADRQDRQLKEPQAHYFADMVPAQADQPWLSVLMKTDRQNDLTAWGRTLCIMAIMLLTLLVMGALVGLAEGLSRLS